MPDSKKPLIRFQVIDRCIRNKGKRYGFEDILNVVNDELNDRGFKPISRTTFYQDIMDMKLEFQSPIETYWDGNKKYYRYTDPDYSFGNQPLNQGEINQIKDTVGLLSRMSGIQGLEWLDDVVAKLQLRTFNESDDRSLISFQSGEFLKGREYIEQLFHAVSKKKVLKIEYKKFSDTNASEESEIIHIHPYHLKEYESRWYILGYSTERAGLRTYGIDRIQSVTIDDEIDFKENEIIDFETYFDDFIGIRKEAGKQPIDILIKFSALMSNYVETKPIHPSQSRKPKRIETDGSKVYSINVIPNRELENEILKYADGAEVIEPDWFRKRMRTLLAKMSAKYDKN